MHSGKCVRSHVTVTLNSPIPGCWPPHGLYHVWCRRGARLGGKSHKQLLVQQKQRPHASRWTSPGKIASQAQQDRVTHRISYASVHLRHQTQNKPPCSWCKNCYLLSLSVSSVELLGFGLALNHWIHCLQVGGVCHEWQRDVLVCLTVNPLMVHPKVVFNIARALQMRKGLWNKASIAFPECFPLILFHTVTHQQFPSPHQRPLTWGRTDRRSDPVPYG